MNKELIQEIKKCKSVDELIIKADEKGKKLTKVEATKLFNQFNGNKELSDDELNNVAGGSSCDPRRYDKVEFYSESEVTFIAKVGDIVEMYNGDCGTDTKTVKINKLIVYHDTCLNRYYDKYQVNLTFNKEDFKGALCKTVYRNRIQKP